MVSGWQHPFLKPLPPALPALLHALAGSPVADQPAVEARHSALTFLELDRRARRLAACLLEQGVHAGDTVVLTDRPGVALSTACLAVGTRSGARVLHMHALLRPADIADVTSLVRQAVLGPPPRRSAFVATAAPRIRPRGRDRPPLPAGRDPIRFCNTGSPPGPRAGPRSSR
ncbi:MAG: AMP-binding protein [Kiritimatiellia bacterium]